MNEREHQAQGIPIVSRFGAPLSRLLPIPEVKDAGTAVADPESRQARSAGGDTRSLVGDAGSRQARSPAGGTRSPVQAASNAAEAGAATGGDADYAGTFYAEIGGHETLAKIVHVFYQGIAADPVLRAMYVEEDLGPAERRMLMFLEQYWGGPRTYLEERGHPRLRMRHMPFAVTPEARDRWLAAMRVGVEAAELSPLHEATLWDYLERAAHSLVNAS